MGGNGTSAEITIPEDGAAAVGNLIDVANEREWTRLEEEPAIYGGRHGEGRRQ